MNVLLRAGCAAILIIVGLLIAGLSILALIDPAGAKMADDNDPFGPPPSRVYDVVLLAAGLGLIVAAGFLIRTIARGE